MGNPQGIRDSDAAWLIVTAAWRLHHITLGAVRPRRDRLRWLRANLRGPAQLALTVCARSGDNQWNMALQSNRTCSREELIAQLREALRASPARVAYLFGSWSRGTADTYSDVDVAVIADSDRPFLERFRDFPGLFELPFPIELLVYRPQEFSRMRRQGNRFIAEIVRTGTKIL